MTPAENRKLQHTSVIALLKSIQSVAADALGYTDFEGEPFEADRVHDCARRLQGDLAELTALTAQLNN